MLGMQNNFCPIPMPMNMNNISPMHPLEDPGEQELMTEVLNIAKIKEGFYVGDKISAISIDVIIQFKITHMINATGNQIMNQWESIGISYLTLNWSETPSQILFDSKDEIANRIVEFVDGSLLGKGEGLLAHSFKGQNRVCIVVLIYLMKKYKWSLNKSMQFLKSKKQDVDIPIYFFEQLKQFENRLKSRGELTVDIPWEYEGLKDPEEKLLRNTYLNGVKIEIKNDNKDISNNLLNNNMNINGNKNIRHIMWADNNPYQKSNLELNNSENDLFFQKSPKIITVHQSLRPRKGCIKGINNNNGINMNNYNMNNNIKNVEMSMENNFANLIKKSMNLTNNIISEQANNRNIPMELNERNNLKIINNNNNYFNQNQNLNQKNNSNNINIINNGKLNNNNNNNNNVNMNNNLNKFGQQQQINKKNIVDVSSSENFINKERTNNFAETNNSNDMRVNNSVNIPKSNNYILNNNTSKNKNNNISPFRVNNHENNNNINNNSSAGFMNMNKNINNNFIKNNHNMSNTQQNFYSEKQMNNIINYTPLIKERNIRDQQNQIANYNPIRGLMNGKQVNNTGNNFNKNIRSNKMQNSNNFGMNNKPLNNYNPKLIKPKGIQHTDSSILNTNKNGGPIKIKNNNYINNLSKKPNTPDINHYNYNSNNYMDNNNQNQNPNRYINNPNLNNMNSKKDIKNDTMAQGWGFHMKNNNYNRKIGSNPVRPSTAPQKDKISYIHNSNNVNNTKINPSRSNQFANNNNINKNKIGRFNQRPSSAGGKSQNQGYGYVNNMNRSGNKFNKNLKTKKSNNISTGINKRLASPQMFNNANGIGFNGNNQNNLKNKFNPAKNRMPSPVVKSNIGKRPPIPNSGQRIHMNKSEKFS